MPEEDAAAPVPEKVPAWRSSVGLSVLAVALAVLPIAVAAVRALRRDWLPLTDNALFEIRARDVLTDHNPLIGTWSSASLSADVNVNHPGPLPFDLLALPTRLVGGGSGIALGSALVNAAAVVGIGLLAHRRGGPPLTALAMVVAAALSLAMGSEVLAEPWGPNLVLLPFLCYLVLVWSIACGDLVALPWAAAVGGLVAQTHLGYVVAVVVLAAWALVALAVDARRRRRTEPDAWPVHRRRLVRVAAIAGAVTVLVWAQPLVEQVAGKGEGNLSRLVEAAGDTASGETIGLADGARVVAFVVGMQRWWVPGEFELAWQRGPADAQVDEADLPSTGLAVAALALLAAVLAVCRWDARRRQDGVAGRVVDTAAVAIVVALVTAGGAPVGVFTVASHQFRWLWGIGAFVALAVTTSLLRNLSTASAAVARVAVAGLVVATAVIVAVNLRYTDHSVLSTAEGMAVARDLGKQVGPLEEAGTLLIDPDLFQIRFSDPYSFAVLAELRRRDIPFVTNDPVLVRHLGEERRATAGEADAALHLRTGPDVQDPPPGARPVAFHQGPTPDETVAIFVGPVEDGS